MPGTPTVSVQFSPPVGIPASIKAMIDAAASTIRVCMYHLTEQTLAMSLIAAAARGIDVQVILDFNAAYEKNSLSWTMSRGGVIVYTDNAHSLLHTKWAIFDGITICTGSANWSANADGQAGEDFVTIVGDYPTVNAYQGNWAYHRSHSIPLPR